MDNISVGVSGGIDSAATVLFLKERGYNIKGVTFSINGESGGDELSKLSDLLNIEIESVDISELFRSTIIDPFIKSYLTGYTPSPCAECNPMIKWEVIKNHALQSGASYWATGHYARVVEHNSFLYVAKGVDPLKDQSYYLWKLSQEVLRGAVMPLGSMLKSQVRSFVSDSKISYMNSNRESMGVCFLGKGGYRELITQKCPEVEELKGGLVVDRDSNVLGTHDGFPFYTLAQRKGLSLKRPMCVVDIDPTNNLLIVGDENDLYTDTFYIENYSFVNFDELITSPIVEVKVRGVGLNPTGFCRVEVVSENLIKVTLLNDRAWAVAKGQPVVFYIGERVVGGGYALRSI